MLRWLSYFTQQTWTGGAARLAIVATDDDDLRAKLADARKRISAGKAFALPNGVSFGVGESDGDVGFLFPGQGSQYLGMGDELA